MAGFLRLNGFVIGRVYLLHLFNLSLRVNSLIAVGLLRKADVRAMWESNPLRKYIAFKD